MDDFNDENAQERSSLLSEKEKQGHQAKRFHSRKPLIGEGSGVCVCLSPKSTSFRPQL